MVDIGLILILILNHMKIEDKFIDAYLTKEGETVEEAKARLKNKI